MRKKYSILAGVLACGILLPLGAQTVLQFPEVKKDREVLSSQQAMQKQGESKRKASASLSKDGGYLTIADQLAVEEFGSGPIPMTPVFNPFGPEDDTKYTYTGINIAAGLSDDGRQTGGLVNFNLNPFACDTVSSHSGIAPYAYMKKGKLNCVLPTSDWTGKYTTLQRTVYDANTLEYEDMFTSEVGHGGSSAYAPYMMTYDDRRDVVYCVTFDYIGGVETYYLNIFDEDTNTVKRIGRLGDYISSRPDKENYSIRNICAGYGTLYALIRFDELCLAKINPVTCETEIIGPIDIPTKYLYGVQPMIYDANSGYFTLNHYTLELGTTYYQLSSYADLTTKRIKATELEKTPTGFSMFYVRPEMDNTTKYTNELEAITDLEYSVNSDGDIDISFTVPDGSNIEWPAWAYKVAFVSINIDDSGCGLTGYSGNLRSVNLGEKISGTIEINKGPNDWKYIAPNMLHTLTIVLSNSQGFYAPYRLSSNFVLGDDAPATVNNITSKVEDNEVTLSWTAPTESRFADFGTTVDLSNVTYTVVRDNDGKKVATDIQETTCKDEIESDEFTAYTYTIYASSNGVKGLGAKSDNVYGGKYLALPYTNNFDNNKCLDGFTVLNVDNNGTYRTWQYNSYYFLVWSGSGSANDWLITPPVRMSKGELYEILANIDGNGIFEIAYGKNPTPEGMTHMVTELRRTNDVEPFAYYISPEEDGEYYIGFHDYSPQNDAYWSIHNLSINDVATPKAPGAIADADFVPEREGSYNGVIAATLPTKALDGSSVGKLTSFRVYDETGKLLGSNNNVTAGEKAEISLSADQGWNFFKVVAVNEDGEGYPSIVKKYVGTDIPKPLKNLKATWGSKQNQMVLSWDVPTEGANGGWIDPENLIYRIYQYFPGQYPDRNLVAEIADNEVEVDILDNDKQDQYIVSVTAVTSEGESVYSNTSVVLGKPFTLPVVEPIGQSGFSIAPYITTTVLGKGGWTVDTEVYNDNIKSQNKDGFQLVGVNSGSEEGMYRISTPIIDFSSNTNPVLNIWVHHTEGMEAESYFVAQATVNGHDYEDVCEPIYLTGNNGWQRHSISLASVAGKKAQVGFVAYTPNGKDRIFADNYTIKEATGNDLSITGISQTHFEKSGDTAVINVTVANEGAKEAKDYIVLFYVNDETVNEVEVSETLKAGAQKVVKFDLPVSNGANGKTTYYAEVLYDGDDNEVNNVSDKRTVEIMQIELPAPTNFDINDDLEMTWDEPVIPEGREVELTFEDTPAFVKDNIEGWISYDGDGHITTSFVQYYGNAWPYTQEPLAWMVWGLKEAGAPNAAMWAPYEGEHCIIAWGNYGADADGRDNSQEPEDDWFISPEVKGGTDFSFMTSSMDLSSVIEVLVSTTDRNPESFTQKVVSVDYPETQSWREISCTLPEDAKYVALHVIANGFGIMVDNIKYTEAHTPELQGYNIYQGLSIQKFVEGTSAKGDVKGNYAVSALYDLGESDLTGYKAASIESIQDGANVCNVIAGEGFITVVAANGTNVNIVSLQGVSYFNGKAEENVTVNVPAGIYAVKVGEATVKVVVR